jgi:hypothetical protein
VDRIAGDPPWGDADGFPDAVDCDNEDPAVTPSLPNWDGYSSPYCDSGGFDCYECPPGSLPPPGDDDSADDDSSNPDDDSGSADDDSAPGDADDDDGERPSGSFTIREGCYPGGGCGFAWTCDGGVASNSAGASALPLGLPLLLASTRRRRASASSPRTRAAP